MKAAAAYKLVQSYQAALQVLSAIGLTTYLWPPQAAVKDGASYDYIVVGAGTAGSVVAARLAETEKLKILLIEAGDNPPFESHIPGLSLVMQKSRYDWNYTAEYDAYDNKCHLKPYFELTLGKMLGGTSSLNYMVYHKGQPRDYDTWAELVHDSTWKWENVLPYFVKHEKLEDAELLKAPDKEFYGTDGCMGITKFHYKHIVEILDAYKELGHNIVLDFNERNLLGFSAQKVTVSGRSRQSSASAFLSSNKDRLNFHVLKKTTVTKILFDADKKAVGVETINEESQKLTIKARKEVIISAGAINTPKLLMLSGIGPEEHLKSKNIEVISNLPVGENLQEHVGVVILHNVDKLDKSFLNTPYEAPGPSLTGFVALDKTKDYPDYQVITFLGGPDIMLIFCTFVFRFTTEICDNMYSENRLQAFNEILNLNPKSTGKVLLRSNNPFDPPLIYNGFFSNKEDVDNLIKYVQDFTPIMNTTYFRENDAVMLGAYPKCNEFPQYSDEYWRCYIMCVSSGLNHFTSSCPMGSVVDSRLRVLGVKGLRIADGSIMPKITRGNPYGPIVMIGEKAADLIKEDNVCNDL